MWLISAAGSYLLSTLLGAVVGWTLSRFFEKRLDAFSAWAKKRLRRKTGLKRVTGARSMGRGERLAVNGTPVSWVVLDGGAAVGYAEGLLQARCGSQEQPLPGPFIALRDSVAAEETARRDAGTGGAWNASRYQLLRWNPDRQEQDEAPGLLFQFAPSDYYNFLTAQRLLIEADPESPWIVLAATAREWDPLGQPLPYMAHSFGINLIPITADGLAVIAQRGPHNRSRPLTWGAGVNEGLQRPADDDPRKAPDFYRAAQRGAYEELGVIVNRSDIQFLSFGVDPEKHQYGLLGVVHLPYTVDELRAIRRTGIVDKWEAKEIEFVPLDAKHIGGVLTGRGPWGPAGAVALIHALILEEGSVERTLKRLRDYGVQTS